MSHVEFMRKGRALGLAPSFNQVGNKLKVTFQGASHLGSAEHDLHQGSFAATVRPTLAAAPRKRLGGAGRAAASRGLPERSGGIGREILVGVVVGVVVVLIARSL